MRTTRVEGQGQTVVGNVKEGVGKLTGDESLRAEGVSDQAAGDAKQMVGSAQDAVARAKAFAKDRPWATAALVGTFGLALFNTLRSKRVG